MKGPNLFLVAAPRSASTQLARWLGTHPDIGFAPVKEPNFFAAEDFDPADVARRHLNDVDPERPVRRQAQFAIFRNESRYLDLFDELETTWRAEASTSYLASVQAAKRIRARFPHARIILLTRDPFDRALSHYRLARRTGMTRLTLSEELARELTGELSPGARFLIRPSQMAEGLARFRASFPQNQLLEVTFASLTAQPAEELRRICLWLGLEPVAFDTRATAQNAGHPARFEALNRILQTSGLKTRLRQTLPGAAKRALAPIWFARDRRIEVSQKEQDALRRALRDAA